VRHGTKACRERSDSKAKIHAPLLAKDDVFRLEAIAPVCLEKLLGFPARRLTAHDILRDDDRAEWLVRLLRLARPACKRAMCSAR
jgi:hypothetical protein